MTLWIINTLERTKTGKKCENKRTKEINEGETRTDRVYRMNEEKLKQEQHRKGIKSYGLRIKV